MTLVLPNAGEVFMLSYFVNKSAPQDLRLRLFKSNTTPAETDTTATFTEADFTGYANVTLTGANWTVTGGDPTVADYAQQSFTSSAAQTTQNVYGYYMTRVTGGELALAERFPDAPYPIANNGDIIRVTPRIEAS
jgi:hypothetical protein